MLPRSIWLVGLLAAFAGCGSSGSSESSCAVDRGELPSWATTGFSEPHPRIAHVVGDAGRITAILFREPLRAERPGEQLNKVLWVAKDPQQPLSDLKIRARRDGEVLQRTVPGGPGPSTVDLPRGCWELSLSWSGRTDHLNLQYR
jgi:hypothetical protein